MATTHPHKQVSGGQLGIATTALVGVLVMAYGVFSSNRLAVYAGVLLTAAAVLPGVVQIITHGRR